MSRRKAHHVSGNPWTSSTGVPWSPAVTWCSRVPFTATVASGASQDECVEQIDIGGPSMVRAAAKNHPSVAVVTSPARYGEVVEAVKGGGFDLEQRKQLAL